MKKEERKGKKFKAESKMFKFLKSFLVTKYSSVFKNDLDHQIIIGTKDPIFIGVDEDKNPFPTNIQTPAELPIHLHAAVEMEIRRNIRAGMIEECTHATDWCSRGFLMKKGRRRRGDQ